MPKRETAAIVLAAGKGTRMKSRLPKVLHPLAGRPMIAHLLASIGTLEPARVVVVVGPGMDAVAEAVAPAKTVVQHEQLGTGHAVLAAREALAGFEGDIVILLGGDPLIPPLTLSAIVAARRAAPQPAVVVLGMRPDDGAAYGRLIAGADGGLERIVEFRDASPEEREIKLCNSCVMAVDGAVLFDLLDRVGNDNAKNEYYLTDIVAAARAEGLRCAVVEGDARDLIGIDSRADLAIAEARVQDRLRRAAMLGGVTMLDPASVHLSFDTAFGHDVVVEPHVVFGPGVRVGDGVSIRAFSHIEDAAIADGVSIGPFARVRGGADIGTGVRLGNFVEVKNAAIEAGAKIAHLSYVGDAHVGKGANIGAGTITCNYDGLTKSRTDIGAGVFIGSNSALVAPVKIGDGAIVGAGSVITRDVAANALALARARQREVEEGATRYRARKKTAKQAKQTRKE